MSLNPQRRVRLQLVLLCLAVYTAAFAARQILVPGIMPVALAGEPQSVLAVQLAFLLRAVEMMAGLSGILLLIAAFGEFVNARIERTRGRKRATCC